MQCSSHRHGDAPRPRGNLRHGRTVRTLRRRTRFSPARFAAELGGKLPITAFRSVAIRTVDDARVPSGAVTNGVYAYETGLATELEAIVQKHRKSAVPNATSAKPARLLVRAQVAGLPETIWHGIERPWRGGVFGRPPAKTSLVANLIARISFVRLASCFLRARRSGPPHLRRQPCGDRLPSAR